MVSFIIIQDSPNDSMLTPAHSLLYQNQLPSCYILNGYDLSPLNKRKEYVMRKILKVSTLVILSLALVRPAEAQLDKFLKSLKKAVEGSSLSEDRIAQGLSEALRVGSANAVSSVSKKNGYFLHPKIRIPLPRQIKKYEETLRKVGYGQKVDDFILSMNRAAERAAPEAKALFWDAVKQMTFSDARKILNGRDNEATLYFKDKTFNRLHQIFKPLVHTAMSKVGVTQAFQNLNDKLRRIPFTESLSFDLDKYVTDKALDGLFFMLAEEEKKIRIDPAARVTEILREVFGKKR